MIMNLEGIALSVILISPFIADVVGNTECASPQYLERGTTGIVNCAFFENFFGIFWYNTTQFTQVESIVSYVESFKDGNGFLSGEYDIYTNGSLIIHNVSLKHERTFTVLRLDTYADRYPRHYFIDVIVTVTPKDPYPEVEGCVHQKPCILELLKEENITCKVAEVRPQLQLEWEQLNGSSAVALYKQHQTAEVDGDTYNVAVTSLYQVHHPVQIVAFACNAFHPNVTRFNRSTVVLLNTGYDQPTDEPSNEGVYNWIIILSIFVVIFVTLCGILAVYNKRREREHNMEVPGGSAMEEINLIPREEKSELLNDPEGKKEVFIGQLKEAYKEFFSNIKPVPYLREQKFCIDEVFLQDAVRFIALTNNVPGNENITENIVSYQQLLRNTSSKRIIIEADPGYGKSTLTLQFAYEWCNKTNGSFFEEVDILILLRLREMGGVSSIFEAVLQVILPEDSQLNVNDVETIIETSSSVVLLLDGFDEYSDSDSNNDIMKILQRRKRQDDLVVLTTRSSVLPKNYAPTTKRFKLMGFDEAAQKSYIKKVLQNDIDMAEKSQETLNQNANIRELCQVPLFFFMFVHMDKDIQSFQSVTSAFEGMMACFHSHREDKDEDNIQLVSDAFDNEHAKFGKLAFDRLIEGDENIFWRKDELLTKIDKEFYNQLYQAGILVEDKVVIIGQKSGIGERKVIRQVKFHHKIFCEWYAARYLVNNAERDTAKRLLKGLNPFDFQYVYLFSCGLEPHRCDFILDYLQSNVEFGNFANMCILEKVLNTFDDTTKLPPFDIKISGSDTLLIQRSSAELLKIASNRKIPINVEIDGRILRLESSDSLLFRSGLSIPALNTLKKLSIIFKGYVMSKEESDNILQYPGLCPELKEIRLQSNLMPMQMDPKAMYHLRFKHIQVIWCPQPDSSYILDLQSGFWKTVPDDEKMTDEMYHREKMHIQQEAKKEKARRNWTKTRNAFLAIKKTN